MFIAEREGFEPPEPFSSTVFKTAVIDHSTTSPKVNFHFFQSTVSCEMDCKGKDFFLKNKCLAIILGNFKQILITFALRTLAQ